MKITPDASLFQALSNQPRVNRDTVRPAPGQDQNSPKSGNSSAVSRDQSFEAARQAALSRSRDIQAKADSVTSARISSAAATPAGQSSHRAASSYAREAPGVADQKPGFVKLGQLIDIIV